MTSMQQIGYETISVALEVWDMARFQSKDSESAIGKLAFERLFEIQPKAKTIFGFEKGEAHFEKQVEVHAIGFAQLVDSIFQMLGPDVEFIQDILKQVGARHKAMGVNPSFLPFMGKALLHSLETTSGKKLTEEESHAWEEVFDAISMEMTKAMLA